jgi:putative lumazine-binding protein
VRITPAASDSEFPVSFEKEHLGYCPAQQPNEEKRLMQKEQKIMISAPASLSEYDSISRTVQIYIDGGKSGRGADMKPAFHPEATMFGYAGADLFAGPIQGLFDWNDKNGPATELEARIASIDIFETVAMVRLELDNWTGHRFTDLFTMLKVDGEWKIMNKVFHLHP